MSNQAVAELSERIVEFKKGLFGLNEKEVYEYIDLQKENLEKARSVFDEKLAEIKSANELLFYEKASLEQKLSEMAKALQIITGERDSYKQQVDNHEDIAAQLETLRQDHSELEKKIEYAQQVEEQNHQLRKQMVEIEVVSQLRQQQQSKLLAEIEALKTQNKEMLDSFLEQRNKAETQLAEKNLKLTQLLEMHRFTLTQSKSTLEKLVRQFDESCDFVQQIQVD